MPNAVLSNGMFPLGDGTCYTAALIDLSFSSGESWYDEDNVSACKANVVPYREPKSGKQCSRGWFSVSMFRYDYGAAEAEAMRLGGDIEVDAGLLEGFAGPLTGEQAALDKCFEQMSL